MPSYTVEVDSKTGDLRSLPTRGPTHAKKGDSSWKRVSLIFFLIGCFIIAWRIYNAEPPKPQIIHADRYSDKYKWRPAASPVITEKLKDGRLLVRGAFRGEL